MTVKRFDTNGVTEILDGFEWIEIISNAWNGDDFLAIGDVIQLPSPIARQIIEAKRAIPSTPPAPAPDPVPVKAAPKPTAKT
jgi:hypothetical protein